MGTVHSSCPVQQLLVRVPDGLKTKTMPAMELISYRYGRHQACALVLFNFQNQTWSKLSNFSKLCRVNISLILSRRRSLTLGVLQILPKAPYKALGGVGKTTGCIHCPALCPHLGCSHPLGSACAWVSRSQIFYGRISSKISSHIFTGASSTSPVLTEQDLGRKHLLQRARQPERSNELWQNGE